MNGQARTAGLGADTLLDFSAEATLEGEPLTEAEWESLLQATGGLVQVRGQWVEADPERLKDALAHWKKVEQMARHDGLTFFEGMRLIAGLPSGAGLAATEPEPATDRAWSGVQAQLRPYQAVGVNWLWLLSRLGLGGCLADDMGLGKTLQVLALLLKRKIELSAERRPNLLVVPASLLASWRSEITRFTPGLSFVMVHPSEGEQWRARLETLRRREWDLALPSGASRPHPFSETSSSVAFDRAGCFRGYPGGKACGGSGSPRESTRTACA